MNAATAAQQALQHIQSRDMFNFIVKELPEEKAYFEGLFQKVNPDEAASYLEETGRLDEAYELIKKRSVTGYLSYPGAGYAFLERHFKRFPADAKQAALMRINNNLQITGEAAYLSVVNAMILLRKVDEAEFKVQFYTIKEKCKRKTNLIKMIDQKLGKYMK